MVSCNNTPAGSHEQQDEEHLQGELTENVHEEDHDHENGIYNISTLISSEFSFVYRTSGQVLPDMKDEIFITSPAPGIISFTEPLLYPGVRVKNGQQLCAVTGNNITESNPDIYYQEKKAEYLSAKENFERADKLITDKLITREHYLEYKLEYEKARTTYENIQNTITEKGNIISSPAGGYINELFISEGQMVRTGDKIVSIIIEKNLVLKADIPPSDMDTFEKIVKANFTTAYSHRIFSTDEMNGEIVSYGRSTGKNSYYIPIYFRIAYDDELIPGTFADVWLIGKEIKDALIVPNTALMEEYGKMYVFRELEDGDFEKTFITTGQTDGKVTRIIQGLEEGDRIVTENTYRLKLSLQESALPAHSGHNH